MPITTFQSPPVRPPRGWPRDDVQRLLVMCYVTRALTPEQKELLEYIWQMHEELLAE